jgi:hypothetical protein
MIIGCKTPSGFTIETGTPGEDGYKYWAVPGAAGKRAGTLEVPDVVARKWFKDNAKLRYVVDGSYFTVK